LEREERSEIASQFDLASLPLRYPDFVATLQDRLGFTQLKEERGW
jgi:hypothetical protein